MRPEKLSDAIGNIDGNMIAEAEKAPASKSKRYFLPIAAAAACVCLVLGGVFAALGNRAPVEGGAQDSSTPSSSLSESSGESVPSEGSGAHSEISQAESSGESSSPVSVTAGAPAAIVEAVYPERKLLGSTGWSDDLNEFRQQMMDTAPDLNSFYSATLKSMLTDSVSENRVYSPLNIYIALGMLSELTDGNSRAQLLDLLGVKDIAQLRQNIGALWNYNYILDGSTVSVLANSLWLRDDMGYRQPTLDLLAEKYYATSYHGEMGTEEYDQMLRNWINAQTGDLLTDQTGGLSLPQDTTLGLVSTISFSSGWADPFDSEKNAVETFHSPTGDVDCDFMHQTVLTNYYIGNGFTAAPLSLGVYQHSMMFILPDEGVSVDDVLASDELVTLLCSETSRESYGYALVDFSMPKFDVVSDIDLSAGLKALGVTDVFDSSVSDFSPLTDSFDGLSVSQAQHAARVSIDEKGCVAVAYSAITVGAGGGEPIKAALKLDRPFIFAITVPTFLPDGSISNTLLFVGVVNMP